MKDKHLFILIIGVLFLGTAVFFILQNSRGKELKNVEDTKPPQEMLSPAASGGGTSQAERNQALVDAAPVADGVARVRYKAGQGFSLTQVGVKKDGDDCLLRIKNESVLPLVVRLSPHRATDDWGFPYPPVAPGEEGMIDPRYRIEKIAFHNHRNPSEEFSVSLDPQCLDG